MNAVAKNLKKLRTKNGMTQEQLADNIHVTRQAVSNWETGKTQPDVDMLMLIAEALGTDAAELIYGEKPVNGYARYQKKYVVWAIVCAAIAVTGFVLDYTLLPYLQKLKVQTYNTIPVTLYYFIVKPLTVFSFGMLLPAFVSMLTDIRLRGRIRPLLLALGILFLIPTLAFAGQFIAFAIDHSVPQPVWEIFSFLFPHEPTEGALFLLLPFLSGILIFLGTNKKD